MKEPEENEIYNLFRGRLTGSDGNTFNDENWEAMQQLLDEPPRKKKVVMWPYLLSAGVAAMLLLFTTFYFLKPATPAINKVAKSANFNLLKSAAHGEANALKKGVAISTVHQIKTMQPAAYVAIPKKQLVGEKEGDLIPNTVDKAPGKNIAYIDSISLATPGLAGLSLNKSFSDSASSLPAEASVAAHPKEDTVPVSTNVKVIKSIRGFTSKLTLSVLAAPDVNSVNKISNGGQVGTNFGLQFSIQLSKRLSLSSGAFYAVKPYQTSSGNYTPQTANWWVSKFGSSGKPVNVVANCKVLDIPLDVNYLLFSNAGNKLMIGSGLSSYFMLNETYHFSFADPSVNSSRFEINNRNQHILGVINVNATYERKVNNRFGILVQPYLKLPITQIGFGQVDLQSTGVAVGLSWNINSFNRK